MYNTPSAIITDLQSGAPHYDEYDTSSCNGTTQRVQQAIRSRKRSLEAFSAWLADLSENAPAEYRKLVPAAQVRELTSFGRSRGALPEDEEEQKRRERHEKKLEEFRKLGERSGQPAIMREIYDALVAENKQTIYELAAKMCLLDDICQKNAILAMHDTFGTGFAKQEYKDLIWLEKQRLERLSHVQPKTTLRDIRNKVFPPVRWLIPGILPDEGLIVLGGKQKIGKSWMSLDIAIAMATGGVALQSIKVEPCEVLLLALEDSAQRLQDRANKLLAHEDDIDALERVHVYTDWERLDRHGLERMDKYLTDNPGIKLVFIDPWVKVKPFARNGNLNGYDADYEAANGVFRLAYKHHVCIVIYAHLRKMKADDPIDALNATGGLAAAADSALVIMKERDEDTATMHRHGRVYPDDNPLSLTFDKLACRWKINDEDGPQAWHLTPERQVILDLLKEVGPLTPIEIANELGLPPNNVRFLLSKMYDYNQIARGKDERAKSVYFPVGKMIKIANSANTTNSTHDANSEIEATVSGVSEIEATVSGTANSANTSVNRPVRTADTYSDQSTVSTVSGVSEKRHFHEAFSNQGYPDGVLEWLNSQEVGA